MDETEEALMALDEATATFARRAVEALMGAGGNRVPLSTLNQLDLQHFLWDSLPGKWLTDDDREQHEIAWALGDFFETASLERFAALCRDSRTHEIISAWVTDPEEGRRLAEKAQKESGLVPPDTALLTFGEVMQQQEARTHARVSEVLESAIGRGDLDPAGRGFKTRSRGLVEAFLNTPSMEYEGASPLNVVRRERTALWAHRLNPRVTPFWTEVLPALQAESLVPANLDLSLAPAKALLEAVGDGVTLTGAGYLPAKLAVALDERFAWTEVFTFNPRGEGDIPPLQWLREHLREQRLLTTRGNKLTVSAEGRRCLGDAERLWRAVVTPLPRWRDDFAQDALAVMAACLIRSSLTSRDELVEEVAYILSGKWAISGDFSLEDSVEWARLEWYRLGRVLGWWDERSPGRRRDLALSSFGRAAAVSLFWSVAAAPSRP
jgi:hypothetical protein